MLIIPATISWLADKVSYSVQSTLKIKHRHMLRAQRPRETVMIMRVLVMRMVEIVTMVMEMMEMRMVVMVTMVMMAMIRMMVMAMTVRMARTVSVTRMARMVRMVLMSP